MTALCGGGTSSAKAGVAQTIIFTAGALSSLLNNKGGWWATLAAPLLGVLAYDATTLCGTDPPAQPTITAAEYQALLQLGPWDDLTSALAKLADTAKRLIWYDMCECDSVTTPALPANELAPPANVTIPNYGGAGVCPQPRARLNVPLMQASGPNQPYLNVTQTLFPGYPVVQSVAGAVFEAQDIIQVPANWNSMCSQLSLVSGTTGASSGYGVGVHFFGPTRTYASSMPNNVVTNASPLERVGSGAPGSCASPYVINHTTQRYMAVISSHAAASPTDGVVDYELTINCSGEATTGIDCCSDPAVIALLSQLMQQVNLIQRQQVPFAYVDGATYPNLTGSGEIAVQGLLGALVAVTDGLDTVGTESGTPVETFDAGWFAWGNADGFAEREHITHEFRLSLPSLAGQYTRIGYTLPVGVEISITELVRES